MPATAPIDTAEDLAAYLNGRDDLACAYVRLLTRCATEGYPVGVLGSTVQAEALSDWEAAMCLSRDVKVQRITETRKKLCRASPLITRAGSRKGKAIYTLNSSLLSD